MTMDERYMRRCLELAELGRYYVAPNPMVGAVLVSADGRILAEGWHEQYGRAHAEVNCFADAARRGVTEDAIHAATLYVSLEPCSHYGKTPPCAELIVQKHPARVVAGMADPNPLVSGKGLRRIEEAGIATTCGVLEADCRELNKRFLCLMEQHRPYVILKWAQTRDGFVDNRVGSYPSPLRGAALTQGSSAAEDDKPLVISSPFTKQLVHQMRAENMAILVGAGTVAKDHPKLRTTRWAGRDPIRIALDRHPEGKDYTDWLVYSDQTDWPAVLADMAGRGIHSVLVEGGPTVLKHIIASGIYDEVHIEVSDMTIGAGVKAPEWPFHPALARNLLIEKYDTSTIYIYTHRA